MELGFPMSNIKIHPDTQQGISPDLYQSRLEQWGCKVLGAYIGSKEYKHLEPYSPIVRF